jgi:MFS family permease
MLGSITPLGERGRGMSWPVTAAAFAVGAVVTGALAGALLGMLGGLVGVGEAAALFVLAAASAVGLVLDLRLHGRPLPGPRRQVDERWLHRYRGWVYGVAFGFQLGAGVLTVVTTSAVYLMLLAAFLSGSWSSGSLIGASFGAARAASLLPARRVRTPAAVVEIDGRLRRLEAPARRLTAAALACVLAASLALAVL